MYTNRNTVPALVYTYITGDLALTREKISYRGGKGGGGVPIGTVMVYTLSAVAHRWKPINRAMIGSFRAHFVQRDRVDFIRNFYLLVKIANPLMHNYR